MLTQPQAGGEHIVITSQSISSTGKTILGAMVEISQAEAASSGFTGFGRCGTGTLAVHHYVFNTVKPGGKLSGTVRQICITARGTLESNFTRIYYDDEAAANAAPPPCAARHCLPSAKSPGRERLIRSTFTYQATTSGFFDL